MHHELAAGMSSITEDIKDVKNKLDVGDQKAKELSQQWADQQTRLRFVEELTKVRDLITKKFARVLTRVLDRI